VFIILLNLLLVYGLEMDLFYVLESELLFRELGQIDVGDVGESRFSSELFLFNLYL